MLDSRSPGPHKTHATPDPLARLQLEQALAARQIRDRMGAHLADPGAAADVGGLFLVVSWAGVWLPLPSTGRAIGLALFGLLALASLRR